MAYRRYKRVCALQHKYPGNACGRGGPRPLSFVLAAFYGAGAILWFEMDADVSLSRLFVWFLALAIAFMAAGRQRVVARGAILAGGLCAQLETWRVGTVMLDSPVTTTVTGRVERREVSGPGRWRYTIAVEKTELPQIKRPPERISIVARGMKEPFEIGQWLMGRARLSPPAGPALPALNDFAFSAYFDGIGANGFFYGPPKTTAPANEALDRSASEQARVALHAAWHHRRPYPVDPAR
jgi:predicted membrane metal-binding protein